MFNELDDLLYALEKSTDEGKKRLDILLKAEEYLLQEQKNTLKAIEVLNKKDVANKSAELVLDRVKIRAKFILMEEITEALTMSPEYDDVLFKPGLFEAAESDENFTYMFERNGWNSRLTVLVDMDISAGTIEDYAKGVEAFRATLETPVKYPKTASNFWRYKVYGKKGQTWKYEDTITYRLKAAGKKAPYWQLLDLGSVPMSSDWGGEPYPNNHATNFTVQTADRIESIFSDSLSTEKHTHDANKRRYKERLEAINKLLEEIENGREDLDNTIGVPRGVAVEVTVRSLSSRYGEALSVDKARKILNDIIDGKEVQTTARGLIELTAPNRGSGTGKRVRPSEQSLQSLLGSLGY